MHTHFHPIKIDTEYQINNIIITYQINNTLEVPLSNKHTTYHKQHIPRWDENNTAILQSAKSTWRVKIIGELNQVVIDTEHKIDSKLSTNIKKNDQMTLGKRS